MKKAVLLGLTVLLLCLCSLACAQSIMVDGLIYELREGTYHVVNVDNSADTVVLHGEIDGYKVVYEYHTVIKNRDYAFGENVKTMVVASDYETVEGYYGWLFPNVESLVFEEGVRHIKSQAFSGLRVLPKLSFPATLETVGDYAFEGCVNLKEISIPITLVGLSPSAFCNCNGIEKIIVADGHPNYQVIDGVLYTKGQQLLLMPNDGRTKLITNENTATVSPYAFCGNETVTELLISEGLTDLTMSGFYGLNALEKVTLPQSLVKMNRFSAFNATKLRAIEVVEGNPYFESREGVLYRENQLWFLPFIGRLAFDLPFYGETTVPSVFSGNGYIESISIQRGYEVIPYDAFSNCVSLKQISLPLGLKTIEPWAFSYCEYLESITIPPTVTKIGDYAFSSCKELKRVIIPSSVTEMGSLPFSRSDQVVIQGEKDSFAYRYALLNNIPFTTGTQAPYSASDFAQKLEACVVAMPSKDEKATMYDKASSKGKKLGSYLNGTTAIIKESGSVFTLVEIGGKQGYIANDNLVFTNELTHLKSPVLGRESNFVRGKGFYVYEQPYEGASKLKITSDPDVLILDTVGTWYQVYINNKVGYVSTYELDVAYNADEDEYICMISVVANPDFHDRLHLRDKPSTSGKSLGRYFNGTQVEILEYQGEWVYVRVDGKTGYMLSKYVTTLYLNNGEATLRGNG